MNTPLNHTPLILSETFETIKKIVSAANEIIPELCDETKPKIRLGTLLTTDLGRDPNPAFTKIGAVFVSFTRLPRQILFEQVNIKDCKKGDYRISISPFGTSYRALTHYIYVSENQGSNPKAWVVGGDEARKAERKERKATKKGSVLTSKPRQIVVTPITNTFSDCTVAIIATILKPISLDFVPYAAAVAHHLRKNLEIGPDTPSTLKRCDLSALIK